MGFVDLIHNHNGVQYMQVHKVELEVRPVCCPVMAPIHLLMSESGGAYSWDVASDELKKSLFGLMAVNDLVESAFGGLTAQLEIFGKLSS